MASWQSRFSEKYGAAWVDTKRRYWSHPLTRKRCFWCNRKRHVRLELHHVTYWFGHGDAPLWVLRPMCAMCHSVETWLGRRLFTPRDRHGWGHLVTTWGGRWLLRLPVLVLVAYLWQAIGIGWPL